MEKNLTQINLTWTLTKLTSQRLLKRKSTWAILALGMVPCAMALVWIMANVFPDQIRLPKKPFATFQTIESTYFLWFYVQLVAIFLGLGTINDEIESKSLTFTLVRPLTRISIAAGRYLGHLGAACALISIALVANYIANMLFQIESFIAKLPHLINALFMMSCAMAAYLGVVAAVGTLFKRFAILGSLIWLVFDSFFSLLPVATLQTLSIKYKILSGYVEMLPQYTFTGTTIEPASPLLNGMICLMIGAVSCAIIAFRLYTKEIILSDDSG